MDNSISVSNCGNYILSRIAAIPNRLKAAIISGGIIGFITHLLYITGTLLTHDSYDLMFDRSTANLWQTKMMRWGFDLIYGAFDFNQPSPAVPAVLAIIILVVLACFLIEILQIKNIFIACLVSCFTVTYPSVAASMMCGSSFVTAITMLICAMGVYFAVYAKNRFANTVLPILLIFFATSTYQSYIGLACGLFLITVICRSSSSECKTKELIKSFVKYLLIILISLILYALVANAVLYFNGLRALDYQGVSAAARNTDFIEYLKAAKLTYIDVFNVIIRGIVNPNLHFSDNSFKWLYRFIILTGAFSFAVICFFKRKNLTVSKIILIIICFALLPVGIDLVRIFSPEELFPHAIVIFPFILFFLLCLKLSDSAVIILNSQNVNMGVLILSGIIGWATVILGVVQVYSWYRYDNDKYTLMQYTYDATVKFASNISEAIRNTPGYTVETPVLIIFENWYNGEVIPEELFPLWTNHTTGFYYGNIFRYTDYVERLQTFITTHFDEKYNWYNDRELENRLKNDPGSEMTPYPVYDEFIKNIKNNPEFIEMPCYPNYGYTKMIDGTIVVKISVREEE